MGIAGLQELSDACNETSKRAHNMLVFALYQTN